MKVQFKKLNHFKSFKNSIHSPLVHHFISTPIVRNFKTVSRSFSHFRNLPKISVKLSNPRLSKLTLSSKIPIHGSSLNCKMIITPLQISSQLTFHSPLSSSPPPPSLSFTLRSRTPLLASRSSPSLSSPPLFQLRHQWRSSRNQRSSFLRPWSKIRLWIDYFPSLYLLYLLLFLNTLVFIGWLMSEENLYLRKFLIKNFLVSEKNLREGRIHTLITSSFSQEQPMHFLLNMISLYFLSTAAMSVLGNFGFLNLYLMGGISSSIAHIASNYIFPTFLDASHGASGAIMATASFFALMFPQATFYFWFVIPMPAWLLIGGLFLYDLISLIQNRFSKNRWIDGVDHAGHLGGALWGLLTFLYLKNRGRLR